MALLTIEQRTQILESQISFYVQRGYRLNFKDATTASLTKPKEFNVLLALLGLFFFVVGLFVYLIFFMAEKDAQIYLNVDEYYNDRIEYNKQNPPVRRETFTDRLHAKISKLPKWQQTIIITGIVIVSAILILTFLVMYYIYIKK